LEGLCTDGAPAMTGKFKGFCTLVKEKAPQVLIRHCMIHRENLAAKGLPVELQSVFNTNVKLINFIKARAKNSRLFKKICEDKDANFRSLLLHTDVRWLSRGRSSARIFEAREEVMEFGRQFSFSQKDGVKGKKALFTAFEKEEYQLRLAYLVDIFEKLNRTNLKLQGILTNINLIQIFKSFFNFKVVKKVQFFKLLTRYQSLKA
jgi:hypothetical protein